ncbi:glycosyltransferase family 2 protein [Alteromonas confluentis]|uniref:Glycosyl transferase n=1 Tax=Alteromonas confluentis TaxID=1656094 RepID=A0A1E7Z999_9ALTE|nr:glycosyltransferase family 2 protein [Alteromonas confluentis]OFC70099.1 glycosyl transferase [Alteromonas confluentis]
MKKYAMMTVKGAVGLLPKSVKSTLKDNHKLTEFYSRSLQRSGLFYGFPSKKKRMALYSQYLKEQEKKLNSVSFVSSESQELRVFILGKKDIEQTLRSLENNNVALSSVIQISPKPTSGLIQHVHELPGAIASLQTDSKILFLNSGDVLTPGALKIMLMLSDDADITYCDTDKLDKKGKRTSPHFLPDWSPDLQFSTAYITTGVMLSASLLKKSELKATSVAGLVSEIWLTDKQLTIQHLSYTLIHRTQTLSMDAVLGDMVKIVRARSAGEPAFDKELKVNHVQWPALSNPLVSLIIPTKNGRELVKACIESILEKTTYTNYEILLIDNGSDEPASLEYFETLKALPKIRVLEFPGEFNYSAINNFGVEHASGEVVGLINNDIEVIKPEWLTYMVGHAMREDIGCVGAKLLYSDGRVQHAGVVLGYGGGAGHAHKYFPRYHPGYMKRLVASQNYSAVTAACLLVRKTKFIEVGGLNEKDLTVAFNDVDFCLRVRETGVRNIYCAEAELYHHESVSRGLDLSPEKAARFKRELEYLQARWCSYIEYDPAYSPNLTLKRENFSVKTKEEFTAVQI